METTPVQLEEKLATRSHLSMSASSRPSSQGRRITLLSAAVVTIGIVLAALFPSMAQAASGSISVSLGSSARFSVLASAAATIPGSDLPGEVGAGVAITDDAGTKYGSVRHAVNDAATISALSDAKAAYDSLAALAPTGSLTGADLGGQRVHPGVYPQVAAYTVTTSVTFDAQDDPNATFVMQSDATLNTTASTTMTLVNGASASNIFWVLKGAATLGASSHFSGTVLSGAGITVGAGSHINGRAFALNGAVTLDSDVFGEIDTTAPVIAITGGATAWASTSTPRISGTTDAVAGSVVSVSVGSQKLTATVTAEGTWSVTAAALGEGPVSVSVSVTDAGGNTGRASQTLTVDTVAPIVSITGGAKAWASSTTPTISGTTDAVMGSVVTVLVGSQKLTAIVAVGGTWSVAAAALGQGPVSVSVSVTDAAGNTGRASQALTVDTTVPVIAITGGAKALVSTATPKISGTTDAVVGSVVTVLVGSQKLTAIVAVGGKWSVTAAALGEGAVSVSASVTDAAGNTGRASQAMTVDTTAPVIAITGGAKAWASSTTPRISGTTDAVVGSVVTVWVGSQKLTATVTAQGAWSVVAKALGQGPVSVSVSVTDAAGNTGRASQALTVDTVAPTVTITGGAKTTTVSATPLIAGTTDAPQGSLIKVTISNQIITTTVNAGGTWSVRAASLGNGTFKVTAIATDAAGNTGAAIQSLTIAIPTPTPTQGSDWVANYSAPIIQGTTDAAVGSQVTVTIASQVLTTSVKAGGLWGLRLNPMPNDTYAVSIAVTDPAGKRGSVTQNLRIDTNLGAPAGGSATPCGAIAVNKEVVVSVATQTLTASIARLGIWAVAPNSAASCGFVVVASVADQSGDTGMFSRVAVGQNPAPSVTIDGGVAATASTSTVSGTTTAPVGSKVVIRYSEQTLTTSVMADGTWSVVRNPLAPGIHQVVVAITSAAGIGYAMQMLTTK
jgi:hypothetical protein